MVLQRDVIVQQFSYLEILLVRCVLNRLTSTIAPFHPLLYNITLQTPCPNIMSFLKKTASTDEQHLLKTFLNASVLNLIKSQKNLPEGEQKA